MSHAKKEVFPHQLSWLINNPLRRLLLTPEQFVTRLDLRASDHVLEIGPGSGYFSVAIANKICSGRLELVDLQPQMLEKSKRRLQGEGLENVGYTIHDASTPLPFSDESFDRVVMVSVLGEIADEQRCLNDLHRVLHRTGILAVHEHWPDPDRIPFDRLVDLVQSAGFNLRERHGPSWNFTAMFTRSSVDSVRLRRRMF